MKRIKITLFLFLFATSLLAQNWEEMSFKQIEDSISRKFWEAGIKGVFMRVKKEEAFAFVPDLEVNFYCKIIPGPGEIWQYHERVELPEKRTITEYSEIYKIAIQAVGEICSQVSWVKQVGRLNFEESLDMEYLRAKDCIEALAIIKTGTDRQLDRWIDEHIKRRLK